jgi:uncharacterized membrane protein
LKTGICTVTGVEYPLTELVRASYVRPGVFALIKKDFPDFNEESFICYTELNKYRNRYLEEMLTEEMGELSHIEKEVITRISEHDIISSNIEPLLDQKITLGERLSDRIAEFGGSWRFIIIFFVLLFVWMAINVLVLVRKAFDPYPFILLNLCLSCIAAIQAPIIMMSQNRKESKDRLRSENDYKVNLKAEMEIRIIHEKLDHLIMQQNQRLMEIQQIQVDIMEDIFNKSKSSDSMPDSKANI